MRTLHLRGCKWRKICGGLVNIETTRKSLNLRSLTRAVALVTTGDLRVGFNSLPRIFAIDQEDASSSELEMTRQQPGKDMFANSKNSRSQVCPSDRMGAHFAIHRFDP